MKKFNHLAKKQKKTLSFTVIPSTSHKIIQFNIPYWVPIFSTIIIVSLIISTVGFSTSLFDTTSKLTSAKNTINSLRVENYAYIEEISFLKGRTIEIEDKLISLYDMQNQVLAMVGLDPSDSMFVTQVSNDIIPSLLVSRSSRRSMLFDNDLDMEVEMELIDDLISRQKENMQKLIDDVEEQLKYIDSLPNLQPTTGKISSAYGYRISPINRRREFHSGIDIANRSNTDIFAAGSGVVTFSGYNGAYGRMIIISHGYGYTSVYAHNTKNLVKVGERVEKGEVIAKMGSTGRSTGPHLHFEVRKNGRAIDPSSILDD
ncbi:M23 family metallopeptidase [Alkaliphilus peptidifermentans]|uniref:Peptidase family M23 n=1 Tax=Alkaliphilus peptidifermentans DSM 18978 TaxID=1120976 RepID=A0A1G5CQK2_9FIRM|nr:M23 family metallopeptidase [Alkaliphilus peptidifermentans]SCY04672.1 Peptidase family M23 [Alkaliphilus peptidifermentans DSM 18978]